MSYFLLIVPYSSIISIWFFLNIFYFYFLKDFTYLFLEREREGVREGVKHQCVVASHWGPSLQPRHVP